MPTIRVNDANFYYELSGQGQPLILIAGYTWDHLFWLPLLAVLTQYYQVLIFDNRGTGQTQDAGGVLDLATMAEDTIALANKLGLVRPHILGQSMGGAIAQIIARNHADNIGKLILLNTSSQMSRRTLSALKNHLDLRKQEIPFDLLVETVMPWFFASQCLELPQTISNFKKALTNNPFPQSIANQQRQLQALHFFNSNPWLSEIQTPTCIIAATDDIICTMAESLYLHSHIAHARIEYISGGHSSPLEQPQAVLKLMLDFLGKT